MDNRGHDRPQAQFRLDWVDVARGLGIVAVVIGHVWTHGPVRDAMYSFHMPLFFLLSGMLSRPHEIRAFTRRQIVGQMRPYAIFLTALILLDQIVEPLKGGRPIFHHWPDDIVPILLGGFWLRGPYTIFWFVPCLMIARILFNVAFVRWPDVLDRRWSLVLLPTVLLAYALGWWTQASPLGLLSVPMAFGLLWVGAVWPRIRWGGWMIAPLGALSLVGLAGVSATLNMKVADYGWPLVSIAAAIATSLLLFRLSALMAPWGRVIGSLGRASLVIMYVHVAMIHYGSPYLGKAALLMLALIIPWGLHALIRRSPIARRWLL